MVVGSLVLLVATLLHPMSADPSDAVAAFTEYAADRLWVASHFAQFVGVCLIFVGLTALARSLQDERTRWLSDLAALTAATTLATAAVLQAVDGVALKVMVDRWAAAADGQKDLAFAAALAVRDVEIGVAGFSAILFGMTGVLFGAALAATKPYPAWLAGLAVVGGAGTVGGGVLTLFTGFSPTEMAVAMPANVIMLVWLVATGVIMWRRA
jgi:Domain of unknown function (DUF4386)